MIDRKVIAVNFNQNGTVRDIRRYGLQDGRIIDLEVDSPDLESARTEVEAMCTKLLANPVMEDFTVEAVS